MKTLIDFEKKFNIVFIDRKKHPADKPMNDQDFKKLYETNPRDFIGLNWNDRTEWLERNGFEITHENLINGNLRQQR